MLGRIGKWVKSHKHLLAAARVIKNAGESSPLVYHCRDYTQNDFVRTLIKILVTPYCLLKCLVKRDIPGREGLAFVLIAKNEAAYIKEWLDFHIKQGVSKFIIYDNESTDNFREVLSPYIESGVVIYDIIKGRCRQLDAYNMALNKYRSKFKYMGFIDADEFVFVRNNTYGGHYDLAAFMDDFMAAHPNAGGLGINWLIFGSGHHKTRPAGGVLENFTMCAEKDFTENHHIKTICDPVKTLCIPSVHHALYTKGFHNLNENGTEIYGNNVIEVCFDKIRINHYFTKFQEEFIAKRSRGTATDLSLRPMHDFDHHDRNEIIDTDILSRR